MKKVIIFLIIYLVIGVLVTGYRMRVEHWSRGGPEIAIVIVLYPIIYPYGELVRFTSAMDERAFHEEQAAECVALLCPPAFQSLLRDNALHYNRDSVPVSDDSLLQVLKKTPLDSTDPRVGYVLQQLIRSIEFMDDAARAKADAAVFAARGEASSLWIAAALLHGAHSLTPHDAALVRDVLAIYERVHAAVPPAEKPFAVYALGSAYEACGMQAKALVCYKEAMQYGRLDLSMQALTRAVYVAKNDEERLALIDHFVKTVDLREKWLDTHLSQRFNESGWGEFSPFEWQNRRYEGTQIIGRHLFALESQNEKGIQRLNGVITANLEGNWGLGQGFSWWTALIMSAEPAFESFPTKLAMVERLLDKVFIFTEEYADIKDVLFQSVREAYYQLYAETGDSRWLECALPSQLKLRPVLKKFEGYIQSEIALMKGEYRKHFALVARRYLAHGDYISLPDSQSFIGQRMGALEIHIGDTVGDYGSALSQYMLDLSDALYEKGLTYSDGSEEKLRLYDAGELPPPFHDFSDANVHKKIP